MTSVVIWRERELIDGEALRAGWDDHPAIAPATPWLHVGDIWLAADTRISAETPSGTRTVTTDAALKILPITLELYQEREDNGRAQYSLIRASSLTLGRAVCCL